MVPLRSPEFPCVWQKGTTSRESFAATKYSNFVKKRHDFVFWLYGTGWLWWRDWFLFDAVVSVAAYVASVALDDIQCHLAWQMGTWWNRLLLHKQPSHTQLSHTKLTHSQLTTFPFCCKRGAWQHQPYFVWQTWRSGVLLGDTDLHFLSQAWHLWHWAGSGGALGFSLTPWFPWLFMRQAWHLMKSSVFHHLLSLSYLSHPAFTFLLLLIGRSWHVLKSIFSTYPPWRINVFWKTWLVATISLQPLKLFAASCLTLQTLCSYSTLFFAKPYLILQTLCSLSLNFTNSLQPLTQLYLALQTLQSLTQVSMIFAKPAFPLQVPCGTLLNSKYSLGTLTLQTLCSQLKLTKGHLLNLWKAS